MNTKDLLHHLSESPFKKMCHEVETQLRKREVGMVTYEQLFMNAFDRLENNDGMECVDVAQVVVAVTQNSEWVRSDHSPEVFKTGAYGYKNNAIREEVCRILRTMKPTEDAKVLKSVTLECGRLPIHHHNRGSRVMTVTLDWYVESVVSSVRRGLVSRLSEMVDSAWDGSRGNLIQLRPQPDFMDEDNWTTHTLVWGPQASISLQVLHHYDQAIKVDPKMFARAGMIELTPSGSVAVPPTIALKLRWSPLPKH